MTHTKSETPEERLLRERDQLRAEIREAHEALKDLRAATKEAHRLVPELVGARIEAEVAAQLAVLSEHMRKAMEDSAQKITKEFDGLAAILLGDTQADRRAGDPSIPELVRRAQALHHEGN